MKILYDPQAIVTQRIGGVSRYFVDLMLGMRKQGNQVYCPTQLAYDAGRPRNEYESLLLDAGVDTDVEYTKFGKLLFKLLHGKCKHWYYSFLLNRHFKKIIDLIDVVHVGQYVRCDSKLLNHKQLVVTIHDMIHELYFLQEGNVSSAIHKYSENKKRFVEASKHIIAISENTKQDLIRLWQVPEEKISVVYHSSPYEGCHIPQQSKKIDKPFILYVGRRDRYKNFCRFVQASAGVLHQHPDMVITCVGESNFTPEETQLLQRLGIENRITTARVNDEELKQLYVDAMLFIFPSYAEGFGLPILEAFTCGCPVCCSNATCFPEIASDAVCYFDPFSEESIANALEKVISNPEYRSELISRGYERVKYFTRARTVEQTMKVYQHVLSVENDSYAR